jgi:hypothetical protein
LPEDLRDKILCYEERLIYVRYSQARQRMQDWLKKNPLEVSESKVWPPSSPNYRLQPFGLFCVWRL